MLLQRKEGDNWSEVSRITQPKLIANTFTDPTPQRGFSKYRAVIVRNDGVRITSEEVEIAFATQNDLFIYPNPVVAGEHINVVNNTEESQVVRLYDHQGRMLTGTEEPGPIRSIVTEGYPAGMYLLTITGNDGIRVVRRVVIK